MIIAGAEIQVIVKIIRYYKFPKMYLCPYHQIVRSL